MSGGSVKSEKRPSDARRRNALLAAVQKASE